MKKLDVSFSDSRGIVYYCELEPNTILEKVPRTELVSVRDIELIGYQWAKIKYPDGSIQQIQGYKMIYTEKQKHRHTEDCEWVCSEAKSYK